MHEEILTLAKAITAAAEPEASLLDRLCTAAEADWERRLRPGVTSSDCGEALICAAVFTAAAGLLSVRSGAEPVSSFSAGSVSVRGKSAAEADTAAEALLGRAERLMAPFVEDGTFAFHGVRG